MQQMQQQQQQHYQQKQQQQHMGAFCTFCHGRDPTDKVKFSHCVRGNDGSVTCPFVSVTFCGRCYQQGHTSKHCTYDMDMMQLQMEAGLSLAPEKYDKLSIDQQIPIITVRQGLEWQRCHHELRRERYNYVMQLMRGAASLDQRFFEQNCCRYCFNHNPRDPLFLTHRPACCPRLACHICRICGEKGHTPGKCENKNVGSAAQLDSDEYIVDFND